MTAIFEIGMKQYKVKEGDVIKVEKLAVEDGGDVKFDSVIAIVDGEKTVFGKPYISGASVSATATEHGRHKKIIVFKYKPKKGYRRKKGHRQPFTSLKIQSISK